MAKKSKDTLYSWAVRGWKPLAQQIKDWYDSYWHKDEPIPIASIEGLTLLLNGLPASATVDLIFEILNGVDVAFNADGTYIIAAGKAVERLIVKPSALITLKIGSAAGLDDIVAEHDVEATGELIRIDLVALAQKTLYISGITSPTTIKFFLTPA